MSLLRTFDNGTAVLHLSGALDVSSAPELKTTLEELFAENGRDVLIDCENVTVISSIGLSTLLRGAQLADSNGGRLAVAALHGVALEAFEISGLQRVLVGYPSREAAQIALELDHSPLRSVGAAELATGLTLPEEVLLLALQEDGQFVDVPPHALDFALAGAVLMDLCLRHRIDSDLDVLEVVNTDATDEAILDPALRGIANSTAKHGADHWVAVLAAEGESIRDRVITRLTERKILERKDSLLNWAFGGRRYPVVDGTEQQEIRTRILGILTKGETPGPREVSIIALAEACAVFDALLDAEAMTDARSRIQGIAGMDLLTQAMQRALHHAQAQGTNGDVGNIYGANDAEA